MKKHYVKPVMQATEIEGTCILTGSPVQQISGNLTGSDKINLGSGSTTTARSKDRGYWDDEEDWEEDW